MPRAEEEAAAIAAEEEEHEEQEEEDVDEHEVLAYLTREPASRRHLDLRARLCGRAPARFLAARLSLSVQLVTLQLDDNELRAEDLVSLSHILRRCTALETLSLDGNPVGAPFGEAHLIFADALRQARRLVALHLRGCAFEPRSAVALAGGACGSESLSHVDLRGSADLGLRGGWALVDAARRNRSLCEVLVDGALAPLAFWPALQRALADNRAQLDGAPATLVRQLSQRLAESEVERERLAEQLEEREREASSAKRAAADRDARLSAEGEAAVEARSELEARVRALEGQLAATRESHAQALEDAEREAQRQVSALLAELSAQTGHVRELLAAQERLRAELRTAHARQRAAEQATLAAEAGAAERVRSAEEALRRREQELTRLHQAEVRAALQRMGERVERLSATAR
jgi:hypothetical protein